MRTRPPATPAQLRADVWLAAALLVAAILSAALGAVAGVYDAEAPAPIWTIVYAVCLTGPLAVRRRYPEIVAIVVSVAYFGGVTARIPEVYVGNIAVFIAFYTVGAWVADRRRAFWVRAGIIVAMFGWLLVTTFIAATTPDDGGLSRAGAFSPFAAFMLIQFLVNASFFGGAYWFGDRAFASAMEQADLAQRTAELEHEREVTAAQAVALDRVRIARELHDVVAHHVSAMGVQAGAARTLLDRGDPDAARDTLRGVEESARDALGELRRLLETLRSSDADTQEDSTIHLDALDELVAHATQNGLPTTLTVVGEPYRLPHLTEVNVFRVAQEALTNARRHGGPDAAADVRLRYDGAGVELEVVNTGRTVTLPREGLGLVGMRERAAASGGTVDARPRSRGGFVVRLRVPVAAAELAR